MNPFCIIIIIPYQYHFVFCIVKVLGLPATMSCTGCASKFGYLKSERGCPSCGFSYCGKCLSEKIVLRDGSKPVAVCRNCATAHNVDRRKSQPTQATPFPSNPSDQLPPSMRKAQPVRSTSIASPMSTEGDQALRERLQRLKQEMKGPPISQTDLEIRLAKLKGKSFDEHVAQKDTPFQPDNRTPSKRANDLMVQMREEMDMERRLQRPVQDLEYRLARLKGDIEEDAAGSKDTHDVVDIGEKTHEDAAISESNVEDKEVDEVERLMQQAQKEAEAEAKAALRCLEKDKELQEQFKRITAEKAKEHDQLRQPGDVDTEDEDDSAEAEKITKMIMEEEEITRRLSQLAPPPSTLGDVSPTWSSPGHEQEWQDEFPWCCICNEDATLRCFGCDGDLYCRRCFREGHDQFDIKDHRTASFEKKNLDLSTVD